jgi:tetratricopeptide (TPR) repeat protein
LDVDGVHDRDGDKAAPSNLNLVPTTRGPFVGRSEELRLLDEAWSRAAAGERSLVLVAGEPGIGKTRVAVELAERIHQGGGLVLYGRWEEEALWPFQALREALSHYGLSCSRATLRADLGERVRELARLLPELAERIGGGTPLPADPDTERYRLFEAVDGWLTAVASREPVLLVLDDLHWADRPSLLMLQHLMRGRATSPLMVLAPYCHTEVHPGSDVWAALAGFRRMRGFERVSLEGLAADEVSELFHRFAGHQPQTQGPGVARLLQKETGGNPFFLGEILRHLVELGVVRTDGEHPGAPVAAEVIEVPESVREVVQARLARLSAGCRKVLAVAAVVGAEFQSEIVSTVGGIDEDSLLEALEEALAAGVVVEGSRADDPYVFAHAVVRKTLHDELSQSRRARLHHRIALALEAGGDASRPHLAELAYHFGQGASAGGADKALHYARRAGEQAVQQVAYETAARHYRQAIELLGRVDPGATELRGELLLALGDAHNRAGEVVAGAEEFVDAAEVARVLDSSTLLAEAALGLGGALPAAVGPDPRAQALLEEALARLGNDDSRPRALALGRLAHRMHYVSSRDERAALCEEAVPMARRLADRATLAAVLTSRYWALDGPDDLNGQLGTATEIVRLGEALDDHEIVLHGLKASLHALFETGEMAAADEMAGRMSALAGELRQPEYLRLAIMWNAMRAGMEGRFADADRLAAEVRSFLRDSGHPQAGPIYFALTLPWRWLRGRLAEAKPGLDRAVERDPTRTIWHALSAWTYAETGQLDLARSALEAISLAGLQRLDRNFDWWNVLVAVTNTTSLVGLTEWAEFAHTLLLPYEERNATIGQAAFLGAASHHLGVLSAVLERWDDAVGYFDAALERHRAMNAGPFVVMTQRAYSDALFARARPGDRGLARELAAEAVRTAPQMGLKAAALRSDRGARRYPDTHRAPRLAQ